LAKNVAIRSVVTKIGHIDNLFRFYRLECIAGDTSTFETIHIEDRVRFKVDISKMYWCSRLSTERTRMINKFFKPGQVLCDMFCGIGPQAIKAVVKVKDFKVLANDLNPEAVACMRENIKLNKVQSKVLPFCMDARAFVKMCVNKNDKSKEKLSIPHSFLKFDHCFMNLPMDAVEFLDAFIGVFNDADPEIWASKSGEIQLPIIHVTGFTSNRDKSEAKVSFIERIGKAMDYPGFSDKDVLEFHDIRDVSPT
jgi:tRNA (guanine37-N1)-methyltransferase